MRRSIRLALPIVAAATAMALTGCNSDDEGSPFDGMNSGGGGQEETEGGASEGETGGDAPEDTTGGETGGETGGGAPGDITGGATGGETGGETGSTGGDTGGTGGGGDTAGEIEGDWYTGTTINDANLEILSGAGTLTYYEDFGEEGDVCEGTIADGSITLETCRLYGNEEWTDMAATYTVDGTTMQVTWSSGTTQTYYNALGGGFSEAELTELQEMLDSLQNM